MVELVSLNKNLNPEWGFPLSLQYNEDNFNGHQVGLGIAILNKNKEVSMNLLSSNIDSELKDKYLNEMLERKDIVLTYRKIIAMSNDGKLEKSYQVCLPYSIKNHSIFEPTNNFESMLDINLSDDEIKTGCYCDINIELLLVKHGLNRYYTISKQVRDNSEVDSMYGAIDDFIDDLFSNDIKIQIDMYDEIGNKEMESFDRINFKECINSCRVIEITHIMTPEYLDILEATNEERQKSNYRR